MITFATLLTLLEGVSPHDTYRRFGIMTYDGVLHDGLDMPDDVRTHNDVADEVGVPTGQESWNRIDWAQEMPSDSWGKGWRPDSSWFSDRKFDKPKLNIRTYTRRGLEVAIKYFNKFPHVAGRAVHWEHFPVDVAPARHKSTTTLILGQSIGILNKMKALLARYPETVR